ncbi:MAG: peptidase S11 [Nitrosospira sp. 56-18]|jgi:D-alanyl-D-alanine endopeptidase (penicillin-binding protein 7)|nr:D-alanyl-D-alanine endopeptidase [Nitrosospira sp.]OJY12181.1 MAG: peptidase S11 [Nitrosospira sp. 56-18]
MKKKITLAVFVTFALACATIAQAGGLHLRSHAALILDAEHGRILFSKNPDNIVPIASITKLMTAIVVLDAKLPLKEGVVIEQADVDVIKNTRSRLRVGTRLSRYDLLRLALMSSENRAAAALGRAYPGGINAFVEAMNNKAFELGMGNSYFVDSTGLNRKNVSTARDLAKLVEAAEDYDLIRQFSTTAAHAVEFKEERSLKFVNSNRLVRSSSWEIGVSKTGFLREAGRCLVMQAKISGKPIIIVLLDSAGKNTRIGDANRVKKWMETGFTRKVRG